MGENHQKLEDLEVLITHQAKEIAELNEVVTHQAKEIDTLKQYVKIKLDKIENSLQDMGKESKSVTEEATTNKPPHY